MDHQPSDDRDAGSKRVSPDAVLIEDEFDDLDAHSFKLSLGTVVDNAAAEK